MPSTASNFFPPAGANAASVVSRIFRRIAAIVTAIDYRCRLRGSVSALALLDDHTLSDIGIGRLELRFVFDRAGLEPRVGRRRSARVRFRQ